MPDKNTESSADDACSLDSPTSMRRTTGPAIGPVARSLSIVTPSWRTRFASDFRRRSTPSQFTTTARRSNAPGRSAAVTCLMQFGDFRIVREIGKGGMGIVYEAEQVSLGRHVALKVLPMSMLIDAEAKRRFEREAKSAAKLHHTNIVPIFGVGEQDGMPYYVMQFIQGQGLDAVLEELKKLELDHGDPRALAIGELRVARNAGPLFHRPGETEDAKTQADSTMLAVGSSPGRSWPADFIGVRAM